MRVLKLHHPTGHPYWQADEFKIQMPDGSFFDLNNIPRYIIPEYAKHRIKFAYEAHRIIVKTDGIYYQMCGASSGGGKNDYKEPFLVIPKSEYDAIEYVGDQLTISSELQQDIDASLRY